MVLDDVLSRAILGCLTAMVPCRGSAMVRLLLVAVAVVVLAACFVVCRLFWTSKLLYLLNILSVFPYEPGVLLLSISMESLKVGVFELLSGMRSQRLPEADVRCLSTAPVVFGFFLKQYFPPPSFRTGVAALGIEGCPGEIDPEVPGAR